MVYKKTKNHASASPSPAFSSTLGASQ